MHWQLNGKKKKKIACRNRKTVKTTTEEDREDRNKKPQDRKDWNKLRSRFSYTRFNPVHSYDHRSSVFKY